MPYVRTRGNQLAIVHGKRHPETRQVEQQVLFVFYSKQEALAASGGTSKFDAHRFRDYLQERNPDLRFDWSQLSKEIEARLEILPDAAAPEHERIATALNEAMIGFARRLALAGPLEAQDVATALASQRSHLKVLRSWIDLRLDDLDSGGADPEPLPGFRWELALRNHHVPDDLEEMAVERYNEGDDEDATAMFTFLVQVFPAYAEGWNYLGLVALRSRRIEEAIAHFQRTMEVGRGALPRRVAKNSWWSNLDTRPYMRGQRNLAVALQRAGRYRDVITVATTMERECGDEIEARAHLASAHLCLGEWQEARSAALYIHNFAPLESLLAAFAAFELGDRLEAATGFIHAMLNNPRAVAIQIGRKMPRPVTYEEAEDHNSGVEMASALAGYIARFPRPGRTFFSSLWDGSTEDRTLLANTVAAWRAERGADRQYYDLMMEMRTVGFARRRALVSPEVAGERHGAAVPLRSQKTGKRKNRGHFET
jgi:tetratricopeptide (TPR) repeat protein